MTTTLRVFMVTAEMFAGIFLGIATESPCAGLALYCTLVAVRAGRHWSWK